MPKKYIVLLAFNFYYSKPNEVFSNNNFCAFQCLFTNMKMRNSFFIMNNDCEPLSSLSLVVKHVADL